jgi:hypothetical protein
VTDRESLPILAVIFQSRLRERGLFELMQDARVAAITLPDSPAHRFADFSCPIRTLELSEEDIILQVLELQRRGIFVSALLALGDNNVVPTARASARLGLPTVAPACLEPVNDKVSFRKWQQQRQHVLPCRQVKFLEVPDGLSNDEFRRIVREFGEKIGKSKAILKPARGSCSKFISEVDVRSPESMLRAESNYRNNCPFRGYGFILEEQVVGREFAVDSIVAINGQWPFVLEYLPLQQKQFCTVGAMVPPVPQLIENELRSVKELSMCVHKELAYCGGVTHMEIILPSAGGPPVIVELNTRPGGGMLQEMHRLVSGVQMYRIIGKLAIHPNEPVPGELLSGLAAANLAMIKFRQPICGKLKIKPMARFGLAHANDRFSLLYAEDTLLNGGNSDDDLPAWTLVSDRCHENETIEQLRRRLEDQADLILSEWVGN